MYAVGEVDSGNGRVTARRLAVDQGVASSLTRRAKAREHILALDAISQKTLNTSLRWRPSETGWDRQSRPPTGRKNLQQDEDIPWGLRVVALGTMDAVLCARAAQTVNGSACWLECRVSCAAQPKGVSWGWSTLPLPVHPLTQGRSRGKVFCVTPPTY